jgi:AraC-like DNA-binding protein
MKAYYEKRSYPKNMPLRIYKHQNCSFSFHAHWHSDIELVFVREGTLRFGINRDIKTLGKGDVAICCSGDIHFYENINMESTIYILIFKPSFIGCHGNWPEDIRFKSSFITHDIIEENKIDPSILSRIKEIFHNVYHEMKNCEPYFHMFVGSKIMELCGILQRSIPSLPIDYIKENKRISNLKIMQKIIYYLESNYMNPLTLAETASYFNLSTFHFCRQFQSLTGTNFKHYLNSIRIDIAEEQIKSSNSSITTIALECGFNNIRTFNRVFRSLKGYTPSSLRL